jgi:hypothetical protein
MRLHIAALAAGLMAATVPSLAVPAEGGWGYAYPYCGYGYPSYGYGYGGYFYGYGGYGYAPIYSYVYGYPTYRERRYASHRHVHRHIFAAVRGVRRVRAFKSAAAPPHQG